MVTSQRLEEGGEQLTEDYIWSDGTDVKFRTSKTKDS